MNRSTFSLAATALAASLALPAAATADQIPWQYNWGRSPTQVNADAPGTGYITLTDESLKSAEGETDIVATNLKAYSTATSAAPDVFTNKSYTLSLYLRDSNSGVDTTLTFTGVLNGKLTARSANIRNTFTGETTQTVNLGGNIYTVTMNSYVPPANPGAGNSGAIGAHATVTVITLEQLPEPGTLALAAGGAVLLAAFRRRRKQRYQASSGETR